MNEIKNLMKSNIKKIVLLKKKISQIFILKFILKLS